MDKERKNDKSPGTVRLTVIRPGPTPICVLNRQIICRGCPGWPGMKQALSDPTSVWRRYPIHCPATGLTMACAEDDQGPE